MFHCLTPQYSRKHSVSGKRIGGPRTTMRKWAGIAPKQMRPPIASFITLCIYPSGLKSHPLLIAFNCNLSRLFVAWKTDWCASMSLCSHNKQAKSLGVACYCHSQTPIPSPGLGHATGRLFHSRRKYKWSKIIVSQHMYGGYIKWRWNIKLWYIKWR